MDESDSQFLKQDDPRILTCRGNSVDSIDECVNASDSIRLNREPVLKEIDESDPTFLKDVGPRLSAFRGMVVDRNVDEKRQMIQIESIVTIIQAIVTELPCPFRKITQVMLSCTRESTLD
jgi:hypothetical protein